MRGLGIEALFLGSNPIRVLGGVWVTVRISLLSVGISLVLGTAAGMLMTVKNPVLRAFFRLYLEFVRIMPQLVLLFLVYFGAARTFRWNFSADVSAVIVFSVWGTAEMGDLVRGALISIPTHQRDSARALGMNRLQTSVHIVIPQTLRRLLPPAINLTTRMVKTTSLVVLIGIVEVLKVGQQIIDANRFEYPTAALWVYGAVFLLYFLICWPVSAFSGYLERKWSN